MYQFVDFYFLLDLTPDASRDEVLTSFQRESAVWFPGRIIGMNDRDVMRALLEARRILVDPVLKESYDREYERLRAQARLPVLQKAEPTRGFDAWLDQLLSSAPEIPDVPAESSPVAGKLFYYKQFTPPGHVMQDEFALKSDDELLKNFLNWEAYDTSFNEDVLYEIRRRKIDLSFYFKNESQRPHASQRSFIYRLLSRFRRFSLFR